ncbi:GDYXXLXY domain-containing protein [uncultured Cedecea sp.]|uniref:GDYXXLXY domain-containing protein n=1 Tax=uncultured Cedecea sp. TaxID=988762 RepID=UPI002628C8DF|nr:GDYXXLXY domain-containing protein [uncultured Cedecea sp.]
MQTNLVLKWLTAGALLLSLIFVNISIFQKEQMLKEGTLVILELAPVDPRSLMQGDYMVLNYSLALSLYEQFWREEQTHPHSTGTLVVELDQQHRAIRAHFAEKPSLQSQEVLMKYRLVRHRLQIGTPSYFFQEGQAKRFANARYGEFRVSPDGTALLTHLLDEEGKRIEP